MGKSGIIARNISQMLVSVGIRAVYMSPVDALHGEVGVFEKLLVCRFVSIRHFFL
jgi:D-arabinose 5-phosphate isomerase GutQ